MSENSNLNNKLKMVSKRSIFEAIKSIKEGRGDEAILNLSAALSSLDMDESDCTRLSEIIDKLDNKALSKEVKKNSLSINMKKFVPLFISKEIDTIGESESFISHIKECREEDVFSGIFIGSLQNDPISISKRYSNLKDSSKKFFSKEFGYWSEIIRKK